MPSTLLVGGDAGIGKSTLIAEAAERAGVRLYLGGASPSAATSSRSAPLSTSFARSAAPTPDATWTDAPELAPLARWLDVVTAARTRRRARSRAASSARSSTLIGHLGGDGPSRSGSRTSTGPTPTRGTSSSSSPATSSTNAVVLIGTYRADEVRRRSVASPPARRAAPPTGGAPDPPRRACDRADVDRRVSRRCSARPPSSTSSSEVLARGQGNPFFTEELVAAHLAGETIPAVLSDLLSAEIAALDDAGPLRSSA